MSDTNKPQSAAQFELNHEEKSPSDRTEVFIVDRHPVVREALGAAISGKIGMRLVGASETAEEALQHFSRYAPDVVVTGLNLPDAHGLDLVEEIRSSFPDVRVLVFSMYEESVYAEQAIRAGAFGYVMKTLPTETLMTAIETVQSGNVYLSRKMSSRIISNVIKQKNYGGQPATERFTDREMTVFKKLGEGHSVHEIADQLDISRKTVETYRRRAREKLGLETVEELTQYALQWKQRHRVDRPDEERGILNMCASADGKEGES